MITGVGVVLAAAGSGRRLGGARKQYREILGVPALLRALRPFLDHPAVEAAVVALPPEDVAEPPGWLRGIDSRVTLVGGGAERGDSVRAAVEALPPGIATVLVHDAARPLVTTALIERVLGALREGSGDGAVAGLPVADTIKEVDPTGAVLSTPERSRLRAVQTPQGFPRAVLLEAHARARAEGIVATDDAALVERYGGRVMVVEGDPDNLKITTARDIVIAEAILRARGG